MGLEKLSTQLAVAQELNKYSNIILISDVDRILFIYMCFRFWSLNESIFLNFVNTYSKGEDWKNQPQCFKSYLVCTKKYGFHKMYRRVWGIKSGDMVG